MLEHCFLFDGTAISPPDQQTLNPLDRLASAVVDFDYDLIDFRPVAIVDALNDVQLAFLRIDLEEVDFVDLMVPDNVRHRCQSAFVGPATESVGGEFFDIILHGFLRDRFVLQHVPHDRLNGLAVLGFIRMKTGEDRGFFIKGKRRCLGPVRHAEVQRPDIRSVGSAVCLQEVVHFRRRFEGANSIWRGRPKWSPQNFSESSIGSAVKLAATTRFATVFSSAVSTPSSKVKATPESSTYGLPD